MSNRGDTPGELLKSLTTEKLVTVLEGEPQWFLFEMDGRPVGFMKTIESRTSQAQNRGASVEGVGVTQWLMMSLPESPWGYPEPSIFS